MFGFTVLHRFLRIPEAPVFLVSLWIALTCNAGYWHVILQNSPPGAMQTLIFSASFLSLTVGLISLVILILSAIGGSRWVLAVSLIIAATAGYFTARLGVLFDTEMLVNVLETNRAEALELINLPVIAFVAVVGFLPALLVLRLPKVQRRFPAAVLHKGVATLVALTLVAGSLFAGQKEMFSVIRNHREMRHMIAPLNIISATYSYTRDKLESPTEFTELALDAHHVSASSSGRRPTVHVLMVGETARAANFSLNGYHRDTNRELQQHTGVTFLKASSCGTATAVSLPCMFSIQDKAGFDRELSRNQDNLLDIAARAGIQVYWIDNGNGCKGICSRITNRDVHKSTVSRICPDGECFDEMLVSTLDDIVSTATADTLVVLHQLGSHGPAYYRRYPDEYRIFRPDCRSPSFGDCSTDEITNAYDNTIAYTDHVISAAIDVLSKHSDTVSASLIYVSDHGESLGEHNLFLHGMPYKFAPAEQTHVPLITWLSSNAIKDQEMKPGCDLHANSKPVSHDNLFHTELGLLAIKTSVYQPELDLYSSCRTRTDSYELASETS